MEAKVFQVVRLCESTSTGCSQWATSLLYSLDMIFWMIIICYEVSYLYIGLLTQLSYLTYVKCTHCNYFKKNNRNDYIHGIINLVLLYFHCQSNNQLLYMFCSWRPASTHFLMNFVILIPVSLMDLSSTSNLKVCSLSLFLLLSVTIHKRVD